LAEAQRLELDGETLGLCGFGRIGRLVAGFGRAFDMRLLICDPYLPALGNEDLEFCEPDANFCRSDVISFHCPPPEKGKPILDAAAIRKLKKGALVINTARSGLIDDEALLRALDEGQVGGAVLDVFDYEPPVDGRLAAHPRVIATPHIWGIHSREH
jgi:D-3-phosphoglycerate dehydrogenase